MNLNNYKNYDSNTNPDWEKIMSFNNDDWVDLRWMAKIIVGALILALIVWGLSGC